MELELQIADLATNEKKRLRGFNVLGLFPFYIRYITVGTHVKLCKIRAKIRQISANDTTLMDFYDADLQEKITPLILEYCKTALVNGRLFSWFFSFFLSQKLKRCGHYHIFNLYVTLHKLNEPAFFLSYWQLIKQKENTLLKEEIPS